MFFWSYYYYYFFNSKTDSSTTLVDERLTASLNLVLEGKEDEAEKLYREYIVDLAHRINEDLKEQNKEQNKEDDV